MCVILAEPVLVIRAAGMGSRYGGLKQIDPVGKSGEKIIDYSLYDARLAGFKKAVFIIKEELLPDFEEHVFSRVRRFMEIEYVFQRLSDVPEGFGVPREREKPWGTGHAALCAARVIDGPYAVINADDFYGREGFQKIYQFLKNAPKASAGEKLSLAMVGYRLENTVTENGFVSRGVCSQKDGKLQSITERTRIEKRPEGIAYTEDDGKTWNPLPADTTVSMNLWGFPSEFTAELKKGFERFFRDTVPQNPRKAEYFLPFVVEDLLKEKRAQVEVLTSPDKWFGVTYQADKASVVEAVAKMTREGKYPSPLWKD